MKWNLSQSSSCATAWAAYALADFINPKGAEITELHRERFAEHEHPGLKSRTAVAVWVICAEGDEEAGRLATSGRMTFTPRATRPSDRRSAAG
jgi:alkanesulfonate monooxygenase SsuD/methylene tetrahydromethanopterin reductase-like flavin-dependent oxidoreductase (luciferase family)